jgi:hypothetical protein
MKQENTGSRGIWIALLAGMAAVALALLVWCLREAQANSKILKTSIPRAVKDLDAMRRARNGVVAIRAQRPREGADPKSAEASLIAFLEDIKKSMNLANKLGPPNQQPPARVDQLLEYGIKVDAVDLPRETFAKYMLEVENGRPFLKTKDINITFNDTNDIKKAFVVFAYYKPAPVRK